MTIDAELTLHILHHGARKLAEDDLKGLAELGFSLEEIRSMETLTLKDLVHLGRLGQRFLDVRINHQCLQRALTHIRREADNEKLQDALLRLRAPAAMMRTLFGMTPLQCANRRKRLGLFGVGIGRPTVPTEETERAIWAAWQHHAHLPDGERYLATAEASRAPLSMIWPILSTDAPGDAPYPADSPARGDGDNRTRHKDTENPSIARG